MNGTAGELDHVRLQGAVHYICWICDDVLRLHPTSLHRMLLLAEFCAVLDLGQPLFAASFVRTLAGPRCEPLRLALQALQEEQLVTIRMGSSSRDHEQYFARVAPSLDHFMPEHVSILDRCIWAVLEPDRRLPRQETHEQILDLVPIGGRIPHFAAYAGAMAPIEEDDMAWALRNL